MQTFRADLEGRFLARPNRFIARVEVEGRVVDAHCPNPGRLTELLRPGVPVLLERALTERKLALTLAAVVRPGEGGQREVVVPLASVRANPAVGTLGLPLLFPGARAVRAEVSVGDSRFDWSVEDRDGRRHLVEVKACSEVEFGSALFPDAPSDRALKHLKELEALASEGWQPHIVFAVVHGRPLTVGPNRHTDPAFARALARRNPAVEVHGLLFETARDGFTRLLRTDLPLDLAGAEGGDMGLVVRTEPGLAVVEPWETGWEKAAARGPARATFGIQGPLAWAADLEAAWAAAGALPQGPGRWAWAGDPRDHRGFIDAIMALRHRPVTTPG